MFDFLKKKIKDSITSIQKRLSNEENEEQAQQKKQALNAEHLSEDKIKLKQPARAKNSILEKEKATVSREEFEEKSTVALGDKKKHGLIHHRISESDITALYTDIKAALLENNVAVSVLDAIHKDLQDALVGKEVSFLNNKKEIDLAIKASISDVMLEYPVDEFLTKVKSKKPFIILFIGVNGAGKTTTLAKLVNFFRKKGLKVVVSASDTFRAASIEQLEIHTKRLGVELIKHNYGADPAAVAFDAIKHAESDNFDIVLIDTAGRSDINKNLIDELKKVKRVSKPDFTIFVGDALTGNDTVNQAQIFDKAIGIDATILSKADVDKKGGAVISISYVTKKPILFLGTGQGYDDLTPFDKKKTANFILE
jgi:fused signal recognition particle receptor